MVAATLVNRVDHMPIEATIMIPQTTPLIIPLNFSAISRRRFFFFLLNHSLLNTLDAGGMVKPFLIPQYLFHILYKAYCQQIFVLRVYE